MQTDIVKEMNWIIFQLKKDQLEAGYWAYPFETKVTSEAYMIILLRILEIEDEEFIQLLVNRLEQTQEDNGAWKLYKDEGDGNLSITIEAYYALLYSGYRHRDAPHMRKAEEFIHLNGGLKEAKMMTKMLLTTTGQLKWPFIFPIPIEAILLPTTTLINMYDFSMYARVHLVPLLLLGDKKSQITVKHTPNLDFLLLRDFDSNDENMWALLREDETRSLFSIIKNSISSLTGLPDNLHATAIRTAIKYITDRIEVDGTLYNYLTATFFMILAFLSQGYSKKDPIIRQAVAGLKSMLTTFNGSHHLQFTPAHIWNTSLITYALQEAGVPHQDPMIQRANTYLLDNQHTKYGDWAVHNPNTLPGGFGFSDTNTMNPDLDDTTASLRALARQANTSDNWLRGLHYILSMQNDDGGFPAFEKNVDNAWIAYLPIENATSVLLDPSTADLTGRTLEFLGNYTNMKIPLETSKKAGKWLIKNQEKDGSWYGRWGVSYIYGTWAALTGLAAVGYSAEHPAIKKAIKWLLTIQNVDGGWGESCLSDSKKSYVPLGNSTITQTAWAVDALISVHSKPTNEIKRGIKLLVKKDSIPHWTYDYPMGQGLAGYMYFHYHSYQYIFPLLALSHYYRKWGNL